MNTAAVFAALSRAGIESFPWCPVESELSPKQMHRLLQRLLTEPYADGYLAISEGVDYGALARILTKLGIPGAPALVRRMVDHALRLDAEAEFLAAHMERIRTRAERLYQAGYLRNAHVNDRSAGDHDGRTYQVLELINETLDRSNLRQTTPKCVRTLAGLEAAHRQTLGWRRHLPRPGVLGWLGAIAFADAAAALWKGRLIYGLAVGSVSLALLGLAWSEKRRASRGRKPRAAPRDDLMCVSPPAVGQVVQVERGNKAT
ncbi:MULTISPECIES: hypothetical protein [unclassified Pseudomonas]|uniref:hypothetical protein n=1 Tax=unclassified Pseudomonas TaxID=196821 RepID=UPI00235EF589|nr:MULTISPECIES: hypothetical protein [unclassified Pseudomonas]